MKGLELSVKAPSSVGAFDLDATLKGMASLNFFGNIIPHAWFKHICLANGKPDLNAILILSEIVYWYRPTLVKDEVTGAIRGYRKKFQADQLQRSIGSFAKQFGLSSRQVSQALQRLEGYGLITRELRTVEKGGYRFPNQLFLAPVVEALRAVSTPDTAVLPDPEDTSGRTDSFGGDRRLMDPGLADDTVVFFHERPASPARLTSFSAPPQEGGAMPRTTMAHAPVPPWCIPAYDPGAAQCTTLVPSSVPHTEITSEITSENTATDSTRACAAAAAGFSAFPAESSRCPGEPRAPTGPTPPTPSRSSPALPGKLPRLTPAEALVGEALTDNQMAWITHELQHLPEAVRTALPPDILPEIAAGMLDAACFSKCGRDFRRKWRAIFNSLVRGDWSTPASFQQAALAAAQQQAQAVNRAAQDLQQRYQTQVSTYRHFQRLLLHAASLPALAQKGFRDACENAHQAIGALLPALKAQVPAFQPVPLPALPAARLSGD